jgi:outer membrane protein TolC
MKRFLYISLVLLIGLSFTAGCATLTGESKKKKAKVSERTLYSQVPESMRADVKEAEFDLQEAKRNVKTAEETVKIGKLKKELGDKEKKSAEYKLEAAETVLEEKEIAVEAAKLEAIDNANLGDKIDNIKKIAKLKSKKLGYEADALEAKADFATTEIEIKKLKKKIEKMEAKIK